MGISDVENNVKYLCLSKEIEAYTSETQQPISQISSFYGFQRIIVKHQQKNHIAQTNKGFYSERAIGRAR
ncbi:hypothetical protein BWI92_15965 [Flectobacillus sp. BAB-3569]|nr:hypothetical protein BWI92_15965 [Flectobacillus sp. BAB-3569]